MAKVIEPRFRRYASDLMAFGLWERPVGFDKLTPEQQDEAVFDGAMLARARDPSNVFWLVRRKIATRVPYIERKDPRPPIEKRHSIYHVYASKSNDHWKRNVETIASYAEVFNGSRHAAIGIDSSTEPFDVSAAVLEDAGWTCHEMPNDRQLREVVTFLPLLCYAAAEAGPNDAIHYAHTKGNTTADGEAGATIWRNLMYYHQLERWAEVQELLRTKLFVGTHKMRWDPARHSSPFPSGLSIGNWMLAGTYYWFHSRVFQDPRWREVRADRYGAEAWPSSLTNADDAVSLYQPWPEELFPTPNPYDPETYPSADREAFGGRMT